MVYESKNIIDRIALRHKRGHFEAPLAAALHILQMRVGGQLVGKQEVKPTIELTFGGLRRILHFERAGGSVARIGKRRLARSLTLLVQFVEHGTRHQHLATDFEQIGVIAGWQPQRYRFDCPHVSRHIVAFLAIAARYGVDEPTVLVGQTD